MHHEGGREGGREGGMDGWTGGWIDGWVGGHKKLFHWVPVHQVPMVVSVVLLPTY
jgi:hypothetical protein